MIYIGNLDSLSEKDYKTIANDSPDKLLLFAKKGATVPVTQAVKFVSLTEKVNDFAIVEAESRIQKTESNYLETSDLVPN